MEGVDAEYKKCDSDVEVALACIDTKPSIIIISGTGSMIAGKNSAGEIFTAGGYGHLLGDDGSAYDIGLSGIKSTIRYYDGWGENTSLYERVLKFYNINSPKQLVNIIYNRDLPKSAIADFSEIVSNEAILGDAISNGILLRGAKSLCLQASALIDKMSENPIKIGLHGGVLQNSLILQKLLMGMLKKSYPYAENFIITKSPEHGALDLSFKEVP